MKPTKTKNTLINREIEIARKLGALSPQQREYLQPIFDHPRDFILLSLRQVARKLDVDPSTLLRWLRSLGFIQYADFRIYLHERGIATATSIEGLQSAPRRTGLPGLIQKSIDGDFKNLNALRDALDPPQLLAVAHKLWRARRIVVLASDMSASLGLYLEYTLSMIGLDILYAATPGEMVHRTRSMRKGDVLIAITYGRGHSHTIEALAQAARKGAYCIGISDSYLSPLVDMVDQFFITPTDRVSFATSYTSAMAFLNALLVVMTGVRKGRLRPVLDEISEEQRTSGRFYLKEPASKHV
jgi:DNA-binding MurR/RpiR family transcriptional regulator